MILARGAPPPRNHPWVHQVVQCGIKQKEAANEILYCLKGMVPKNSTRVWSTLSISCDKCCWKLLCTKVSN